MNKVLAVCIALFSLLAVTLQYLLMLQNRVTSVFENSIRFISYFTILTNSLVAIYFIYHVVKMFGYGKNYQLNLGTLTAITVYITIVGLIYQIILRQTWNPTGLQKWVDEMLHSVNPLLVLIFWFLNYKSGKLQYRQIIYWLIFPLLYLFYVLIRGHFSNFYPYPFLNMPEIGLQKTILNSLVITIVFILVSTLFTWINIKATKATTNSVSLE